MANEAQKGFPSGQHNDVKELIGANNHEVVDVSTADVVPTMKNCRYFTCDTEGIIKFDYKDDFGNTFTRVCTAQAGNNMWRNIVKVYYQYATATSSTAKVYNSTGASITGICLCR